MTGFCSKEEDERFLRVCPSVEQYVVDSGIQLIKFWLEVGDEEQKRRFEARVEDPLRQWKLSAMDLPSRSKWFAYSRARDQMLEATDKQFAPWYIVRSDDKRRARLNLIAHFLSLIPYKDVPREKVELPKRSKKTPTTTSPRLGTVGSCRKGIEQRWAKVTNLLGHVMALKRV